MTGNLRSWRHFVAMRASDHADREMRQVAVACLRQLRAVAPHVFADFTITGLPDGSEVAASPLVSEQ
jgi:thymidylate synthase (FAD)